MSFSLRNLSILAYSNGFTLWLYQTNQDDRSSILTDRFFQDAGDMLAQGDIVVASARDSSFLLSILIDGQDLRTSLMR